MFLKYEFHTIWLPNGYVTNFITIYSVYNNYMYINNTFIYFAIAKNCKKKKKNEFNVYTSQVRMFIS